jgi:hypothetical protein
MMDWEVKWSLFELFPIHSVLEAFPALFARIFNYWLISSLLLNWKDAFAMMHY